LQSADRGPDGIVEAGEAGQHCQRPRLTCHSC
jgi:hypothetical protein